MSKEDNDTDSDWFSDTKEWFSDPKQGRLSVIHLSCLMCASANNDDDSDENDIGGEMS